VRSVGHGESLEKSSEDFSLRKFLSANYLSVPMNYYIWIQYKITINTHPLTLLLMAIKIDELDQRLISILQSDCQINTKVLAGMLNISQTPLRKRINKLKKAGYLHYYVCIDRSKFPNAIAANIGVLLNDNREITFSRFEQEISKLECITNIQRVSGKLDYHLSFLFRDKKEKEDFLLNKITQMSDIKIFDCVDILKEIPQSKFRVL
jgi:DNA-binding Lrp family transcriptional regulator